MLALRGGCAPGSYFVAPAALRARVGAIAKEASAAQRRVPQASDRWRWLAGGALAGCLATMFVWILGTALLQWRGNEDVGLEAVAAHSRAALGQHLIEVASADQHTVKPWMSARLDYSPPVPDLADAGFPLRGGRLDYLDGHPSRCWCIIGSTRSTFVRPELFHGAPPALRACAGSMSHAPRDRGWIGSRCPMSMPTSHAVRAAARGGTGEH